MVIKTGNIRWAGHATRTKSEMRAKFYSENLIEESHFGNGGIDSGVPVGGGSTPPPPRNSEGPQNSAKINPIVRTFKNC